MAAYTGLPDVKIELLNGQLGSVQPTNDATCALVITGVATAGLALGESKSIFQLKDAEDLGINAAYDSANGMDVWLQIKEFYDEAGSGKELILLLYSNVTTLTSACDISNSIVKKVLDDSNGRIRFWAVARMPVAGYVPTYLNGLDDDVHGAVLKAEALCQAFETAHAPCRGIIAGRDYQGNVASLKDNTLASQNHVMVTIGSTTKTYPGVAVYKNASVGKLLGRLASITVNRNIGRVQDGDRLIPKAYLTSGQEINSALNGQLNVLHDKGYVFFRGFANKSGFFYNDDCMACAKSDDYSMMSRGRIIDKAHIIAYQVIVNELLDDVAVDDQGNVAPEVLKSLQQKIENAISVQMLPLEISGVSCEIEPRQNILVDNTIRIKKLGIRPRGFAKYIYVPLGFKVK